MSLEYLRSFRVLEVAVFDYVVSLAAFAVIFNVFGIEHKSKNYLLMVPVSILVHVLIGQETTMTKGVFSPEFNIFKMNLAVTLALICYLNLKK